MTCNNVITSKGKQKRYFCDYCKKVFDKDDMAEIKVRCMSIGWPHYWIRHFMCDDCKRKRINKDDDGSYLING